MSRQVHLVVLVHGLWGAPIHLKTLEEELLAAHPLSSAVHVDVEGRLVETKAVAPADPKPSSSVAAVASSSSSTASGSATSTVDVPGDDEIEVVVLNAKGNEEDRTYDGIDFCASRVVQEIDREVASLQADGKHVIYFSLAGYSLGGLVARCVLGILNTRSPSFFEAHKPLNFATFASPWIGMPRYSTWFSALSSTIGSRMLSRTGAQLYNADTERLVERLATPGDVFLTALSLFPRIDVYVNTVHDKTVPFPTGGFSKTDPFADYETNGIEIEVDPNAPIITSYKLPPRPTTSPAPASRWYTLRTKSSSSATSSISSTDDNVSSSIPHSLRSPGKPTKKKRPILPPFLRFSFPYNFLYIFVILSLPITVPLLIGLVLVRFTRQSRASKRRLRDPDSEGIWGSLRVLERDMEAFVSDEFGIGSAEGGSGTTSGMSTPLTSDGGADKGPGERQRYEKSGGGLMLSVAQLRMIDNLDALPQLKKHLAFFPEAFNSHAVIIARDVKRFPDHGMGRKLVRHWADRMLVRESSTFLDTKA